MAIAQSTKAARVADNVEYQRRVKVYMADAAIDIMAESAGTANHAERVTFAKKILDGTASVQEYSIATMSNATLFAAADVDSENQGVTDNDLSFAVTSIYNAMAGVATV